MEVLGCILALLGIFVVVTLIRAIFFKEKILSPIRSHAAEFREKNDTVQNPFQIISPASI